MSIRSKAIKLAYERPDLRPKLLPLIKMASNSEWWFLASTQKGKKTVTRRQAAHAGSEILWRLLDQRDFFKLYRTVEKQDKQSAQLLQDITDKLSDSLKIKDNEYNAISRLTQLIKGGQNWDISLQRNNIFKAADLMGIKLPSGMFASQKTAAGLNDLPKVFADMSAMTEGDYEIAMKQRKLQWRSSQWTDVSTWQKAAKAAMPFGYGDFNADKVGRWLKKYEKMGNLEVQAAREYSVALYIRSDNPDLLLQIEKAGRGSSAKVDESDIRKDGTLRLWWD